MPLLTQAICPDPADDLVGFSAALQRDVVIAPFIGEKYVQLAAALQRCNELRAAIWSIQRAITICCDDDLLTWMLGVLQLQAGDFSVGWQNFTRRVDRVLPGFMSGGRASTSLCIDTVSLELVGDMLVICEQGLGDQVLFCSLLPTLSNKITGRLVVCVDDRLVAALARSMPAIRFLPISTATKEFVSTANRVILSASLGQFFIKELADISQHIATEYLSADPSRRMLVKSLLPSLAGCPKIGLAWRSDAPVVGSLKSIQPVDLKSLLGEQQYCFINLQYDSSADELDEFSRLSSSFYAMTDFDLRNDIEAWLAICEVCDVVITVSNSVAHLAGALGRPVLLLERGLLWYWAHTGANNHSLWYPSVRIFRRRADERDWHPTVNRVEEALRQMKLV